MLSNKEIISINRKILITTKYREKTVRKLIHKSKKQYYNDHVNDNRHNPKQLWNSLGELSGMGNKIATSPFLNDETGIKSTTHH